jgi:hypothetical protein
MYRHYCVVILIRISVSDCESLHTQMGVAKVVYFCKHFTQLGRLETHFAD